MNQGFYLDKCLQGMVTVDNFAVKDIPYPTLEEGQLIVKSDYLSVDPYLRVILDTNNSKKLESRFINHTLVGQVICNFVVGSVVESNNADFNVGDRVTGLLPLQRFISTDGTGVRKIPLIFDKVNLSAYIGVLGMPGMTAFGALNYGIKFIGGVILVSGAAGAVGSLAGQLARQMGATKVIGTAGGPVKCKHVVERFGFDACVDYKEHKTDAEMLAALKAVAPEGIDYYYDNTGGAVTNAAFDLLNDDGRVAICGSISQYNAETTVMIPSFLFKLVFKTISIKGISFSKYVIIPGFIERFYKEVGSLVNDGTIKFDETIKEGFDKLPEAFVGLFTGANVGKMVVKA